MINVINVILLTAIVLMIVRWITAQHMHTKRSYVGDTELLLFVITQND